MCGKAVHEWCKSCAEADKANFSLFKTPVDRLRRPCGRRLRAALRLTRRNVRVRSRLPFLQQTPTFCDRSSLRTRHRRPSLSDRGHAGRQPMAGAASTSGRNVDIADALLRHHAGRGGRPADAMAGPGSLPSDVPGGHVGRIGIGATIRLPVPPPCVTIECSARSGPVAQLGARMNGIHEVTGSTPVWSTNPSFSVLISRK